MRLSMSKRIVGGSNLAINRTNSTPRYTKKMAIDAATGSVVTSSLRVEHDHNLCNCVHDICNPILHKNDISIHVVSGRSTKSLTVGNASV